MTGHLVLVGMSVSDVHRRDQLVRAAADRGGTVAFLQMGDPSLSHELTRLADAGVTAVTLVGVDSGPIAPGHSWLRRIAGHWWRERAGARPHLHVATCTARTPDAVDDALAETRAVTGDEPGLTSAAWEDVTGHRHQVLVCRGPRCTATGSDASLRALVVAMLERGLRDDDALLVHTGCQSPCNQAPVVTVQPDDVWYGRVDPPAAAQIVAEHLVGGRVVEHLRLPRTRPPSEPRTC